MMQLVAVLTFAGILGGLLPLAGQVATGSLQGTVLDPAGAAVPAATVTARHEPTSQEFTTSTTEAGLFVFPSLPVGAYSITVEKVGFKKAVQSGIEIRVAQRQVADFRLELGQVVETVEVREAVILLETQTPERGQNFSNKFMQTLPLFTGGVRNPEVFVTYMPGVNTGFGETSISGSGGRAKEVLLDGASQTIPESGGVVFNFPASEQFGEFKLITSNYNAEYGRFGGGVEVFITRSGTNDLHGGAFWNLRRDIFNAAGYNVNRVPGRPRGFRPKERFNEVGGVIGGPVFLPRLYDGRNKTFWFFTIAKDLRPASISQSVATLPTTRMKQGDFSEVSQLIYDPATTAGNTRTPFPNNFIPRSRWSRVSQNVVPLVPDANVATLTGNFQFTNQQVIEDTHWSIKFDHAVTSNNRFAYYMSRQNQNVGNTFTFPGPLGTGLGANTQRPENYRLNHDLVINPTTLLHSTFGFTRQQQGWDNPAQKGWGSKIGLPLSGLSDAFPVVQFTGADGLSAWGVQDGKVSNGTQLNWTFHFNQSLSLIRGKHEYKLGWDFRRLRTFSDPLDLAGTNGRYVFARAQTALPTALATTGHAFASLLLGAVDQAAMTPLPVIPGEIRYAYQAVYFQDNWKLTPKLTLTLGLRYEVPEGWHEKDGNYSHVDLNRANPGAGGLPGALVFAGKGAGRTGQKRFYPTDFSNFGPRLGFAYRLFDKTVLRGGYGVYYQTLGNGGCGCRVGFGAYYGVTWTSDGMNPIFNWDGGIPLPPGFQPPPFLDPSYGNFQDVDRMGPTFGQAPRIHNWSFNIQQEIKSFLIDVAYVGNRARKLNSTVELNQLPVSRLSLGPLLQKRITDPEVVAAGFRKPFPNFPDNFTLAQALRPYPQYFGVLSRNAGVGRSWYDSLQAKVERRFGAWQMMAAYTWSKTLGLAHYRQIFTQSQVWAQDNYNINDMKSYLHFDQPHVLNILNSFDLPIGRGKRFLNTNRRWLDALVGHWTIAAAQRYYSGNLIQVSAPNTLGAGVLFTRFKKANVTGNPIRTNVSRTALDPDNPAVRWFNSGAQSPFAIPGQFQLGNAAIFYNDFRNPPIFIENVSIQKRFKFAYAGERSIDLVYRADAFNLFNRTNFGGIVGTVGNPNFGRPTAPQQAPRIITMGLRLDF